MAQGFRRITLYAVSLGSVLLVLQTALAARLDQAQRSSREGTASISGRVSDRDSGMSIPRVRVTLVAVAAATAAEIPEPLIQTDDEGRYAFSGVPAGRYRLRFEPPEFSATHLPQMYGSSLPGRYGSPSETTFEVTDRDVRDRLDVALWRAAVVNGRVVDDAGQPMAGVRVTIRPWRGIAVDGVHDTATDDRGMFRLFGLLPGRYRLCAVPPDPYAFGGRVRPVKTCYPAASEDETQPIEVASGESGELSLQVQRRPVFRAMGQVVDASGAPAAEARVTLVRLDGSTAEVSTASLRGNMFVVHQVTSGAYAVRAEIGARYTASTAREREVAFTEFKVEDADISNLVVQTAKGVTVRGQITFEDPPPPSVTVPMGVVALPDASSRRMTGGVDLPSAPVKPDLTFELAGLFGRHTIRVDSVPDGWTVRSVRYDGRIVTHIPTQFGSGAGTVEIVLTNTGAHVSGTVTDDDGRPVSDTAVVLYVAESGADPDVPPLAQATTATDGSYRIGPVAAGDVLIAAIRPHMHRPGEGDDPAEMHRRLRAAARRLTLAEHERRLVDLRLVEVH